MADGFRESAEWRPTGKMREAANGQRPTTVVVKEVSQ